MFSAIFVADTKIIFRYDFVPPLKDRYFVMGGSIDTNVDVFWETSVGFLKIVVLKLFPKYNHSYVNLNVKMGKIQLPLKSRQVVIVYSI